MNVTIKWEEQWVEVFSTLAILFGFFLAVLLRHAVLSYVAVVLCGFLVGRVWYVKRYKEPVLPFVLIISGFFVGYLLGSVWANRVVVLILFVVSVYGSYKLHVKKIITIFKSPNFIK